MAQRSLTFCGRWTLRVNSLWLWCYCLIALGAEGYLMYRAVKNCRNYNELPWHSSEKPVSELYAYICLIVLSVMCMPFFVITSIFKIGCYSNDGTRLGRDNVLHHLNVDSPDGSAATRGRFLRDIWRLMGPLSHTFHIIAAFALLLPISIVQAQQIKFGFLKPEKMWSSELEVLYDESDYELKSPASDVIANVTDSPYRSRTTTILIESGPVVMSPEYVNYLLAVVIYSLRYASVYWYTNATFSACFAAALLMTTLHFAYAYCGMQILYKFAVNEHALAGVNLLMSPAVTMVLHVLACFIAFLSPLALFNYGYCQYVASCRHFLQLHFPTYARYVAKMPVGCHGYVPHIFATMSLICFVAFRSPIVYDYVNVYRTTGFPILLTCIVIDALYMVLWIALWFAFTLKHTWDFRVNPQMDMLHSFQRAASISAAAAANPQPAPQTDDVTRSREGDNNNNSRDPSQYTTPHHQQNNVQVVDRPPPYTSQENSQIAQQHTRGRITPQQKAAKMQLPPLHIDTSEARLTRADNSPTRQQPSPQRSPKRKISPVRNYSPNRQNSPPQRQHSPSRNTASPTLDHSTRITNHPLSQQVIKNMRESSSREASPNRNPPAQRATSPGRQPKLKHHSPKRQVSQTPTQDSNVPETPLTMDDTPTTPISPASALKKSGLRKSGERRHNVHQRVTFDDSVDHLGDSNPKLNDTSQLSPNSALRQRKIKSNDKSVSSNIPLQILDVHTVSSEQTPAYTGTTPDNTLTRNYRSSIRDKCGEYYKNVGDVPIAPAAQSSPVTHAQQRPLSDNYDSRELILSPLTISENQNTSVHNQYQHMSHIPHHQRFTSESELTGYYEVGRSRDKRANPGRHSVGDDDRHHSFPPKLRQTNPSQYNSSNNHPYESKHKESISSRTALPRDQQSRDLSVPSRDNQKHLREMSRDIARDLNKQFQPINKAHSYLYAPPTHLKYSTSELNREIKIVKPELNRRDSALPSSNETSSNDSAENMLCSQV